MMDVDSIELQVDGETRTFAQWTADFVDAYYPHLGQRCYRVPALHFNRQRLIDSKGLEQTELHAPDEGHARGDLAHTLVLDSLEHLGQQLQDCQGSPLFIISSLDYDNYLARVKAPQRKRGQKKRHPNRSKADDKHQSHAQLKHETKHEHTSQNSSSSCKTDWGADSKFGRGPDGQYQATAELSTICSFQTHRDVSYVTEETQDANITSGAQREHNTCDSGEKNVHTSLTSEAESPPSRHEKSTSRLERPTSRPEGPSSSPEIPTQIPERPTSSHERSTSRPGRLTSRNERPTSTKERPTSRHERPTSTNERQTSSPERSTSRPERPTRMELPPRPREMSEQRQRGDIDVVLLHQPCGVVLVEVKSTGMPHPHWRYTHQDIRDSVHKAMEQVKRGRDVFHFIMPDLSRPPCVTLVVALPFVAKQQLDKALGDLCLDPDVLFLCEDNMVSDRQPCPTPHRHGHPGSADSNQHAAAMGSPMVRWWKNFIATRGTDLPLRDMKTVVGRVCGLLSTVAVWSRSKPRMEVRTATQAISQAADRIADIVLLPRQASLLAHPSPARLCLTGPMGSGKTLMLQLKGRQWLKEGRRVVVLNVRTSGRGRPIGHVLEEAIGRVWDQFKDGSIERHDLATKELNMEAFQAELEKRGHTDKICFILDELTHHTFFLLEHLVAQYPSCSIWCVAMFVRQLPQGFQHFRLGAVLRSPPSVQLLLKELDLNPIHRDVYTTRSAARGLPCDGPPVIFIHHQQHGAVARPHNCVHCADQLVEVLHDKLGLVFPGQQQTFQVSSTKEPRSSRRPERSEPNPKATEAKPVSLKDILFLICVPLGYYKQKDDGLWIASVEDVYKFCRYLMSCPFISRLKNRGVPMKCVIDNTSREIAIPSTDEIVLTDVMGVQSLERKVIIFLPGGPMLDSNDISTVQSFHSHASFYTVGKSVSSSSSRSQPPPEQPRSCTYQQTAPGHPESAPVGGHTEAVEASDPESSSRNTVGYGQAPAPSTNRPEFVGTELIETETEDTNPTRNRPEYATTEDSLVGVEAPSAMGVIKDQSDVERVFGNMIVGDTHDTNCSKQQLSLEVEETSKEDNVGQTIRPRMGMDVRGDSPWLLTALDDANKVQDSSSLLAEDQNTQRCNSSSNLRCHLSPDCHPIEEAGYFCADSVFPVPDVTQEVGQTESELHRVRQALSALSMDDQDWLFMAAARCLSQLIVFVP